MPIASSMTKHVGKLNNTGTKVAVVFRKLPDDPNKCLVLETDRLPERYHDNIMSIIRSNEAQETHDLYTVLHRRIFPEGGNVLQTLHQENYLRSVPVENVTLYPIPNHALPLEEANASIENRNPDPRLVGDPNEWQKKPQERDDNVVVDTSKTSEQLREDQERRVTHDDIPNSQAGQETVSPDRNEEIADSILEQAKLMEAEAEKKKEEAYSLNPDLRPTKGRPKTTKNAKKKNQENKQERRKIREKHQKKEKEIDRKVEEKIARDQSSQSSDS